MSALQQCLCKHVRVLIKHLVDNTAAPAVLAVAFLDEIQTKQVKLKLFFKFDYVNVKHKYI